MADGLRHVVVSTRFVPADFKRLHRAAERRGMTLVGFIHDAVLRELDAHEGDTVRVTYHREGDSWWADSVDVPGYYAGASAVGELHELVREGLKFHLAADSMTWTTPDGVVLGRGSTLTLNCAAPRES